MEEIQLLAQITAIAAGATCAGALTWTVLLRTNALNPRKRRQKTRTGLWIMGASLALMLISLGSLSGVKENKTSEIDRAALGLTAQPSQETDDNRDFEQYLEYTRTYQGPPVHRTYPEDRQIVLVIDPDGTPVRNAVAVLPSGEHSTTHADGRALLFPSGPKEPRITVILGNEEAQAERAAGKDAHQWAATVSTSQNPLETSTIDLMLLLNHSPGMEDELRALQDGMPDTLTTLRELFPKIELRLAVLAYRDHRDGPLIDLKDFQEDPLVFLDGLTEFREGEETPGENPEETQEGLQEGLQRGLHEATQHAGWNRDSIRILFLVTDTPPGVSPGQEENYGNEIQAARRNGIKIHALGAGGLDEQGEYILRQAAQQTMGRFIRMETQDGLPAPDPAETIQRLILEELQGENG